MIVMEKSEAIIGFSSGIGLVLIIVIFLSIFLSKIKSNYGIFDFNWNYSEAEIKHPNGSVEKVEVKKWWDYNDDQLQVLTKDGRIILTHSVNVVLIGKE